MNSLLLLAGLLHWLKTERGPEFLLTYVAWFAVCWGTLMILRACGYDTPLTTCVMLVLFEGLGIVRYVVGSSAGLHRWEGMGVIMVVGTVFLLVRFESGRGDSSGGSGCSAGGGCGGGGGGCGGGGGGCGGCGGG